MTEEQQLRYDLLKALGYDIPKAAGAYAFIMGAEDDKGPCSKEPCDLGSFDYIGDYEDGFALVSRGGKYNFINKSNMLLSRMWFNNVWSFRNGCALVQFGEKFNFLNKRGDLLSSTWYDEASDFEKGTAYVRIGEEGYLIDTEGKKVGDEDDEKEEDDEEEEGIESIFK